MSREAIRSRWGHHALLCILIGMMGCDKTPSNLEDMLDPSTDAQVIDTELTSPPDMMTEVNDPTILRVRFNPNGEDFYDTPWPSDARLTPRGTPDLNSFPTNHEPFLRVIHELEERVFGFANMPVIYVAFEDSISEINLPTPLQSQSSSSPIQLFALGDQCGQRVPIDVSVREQGDRYINADTLQVKTSIGAPLIANQSYALVILQTLGAERGQRVEPPTAFLETWAQASEESEAPWPKTLSKLKVCLREADLTQDQIALATVFTPQDPVKTLQSMRDMVMDPQQVITRPPTEFKKDLAWSRKRLNLTTYSGLVPFPMFQTGQPPYRIIGGGLRFDDDNQPIIQRWEEVPFAVAAREIPSENFEGPRPVLVFIDGTGWSPWTHLRSRWLSDILDAGFIVFSFMPQFHGERAGVTISPELPTFNFLNPESGRTNFQQQAVETSYFLRVIREQLAEDDLLPDLDVTQVVYGGHSQGAVAGALNAAVESEYAAYVFNGLSSYLTMTILEREDLLDFEQVVRNLLNNEYPLDLFSPALQFMQMGSESVDPYNFAQYWRGSTGQPLGNHIFLINGFNDETTTPRGIDHLTLSAQIPIFDAPGWDIDPQNIGLPDLVSLPVTGNVNSLAGHPLTIATYLDPKEGHFTVYRNPTLRKMTIKFWETALSEPTPILQASNELLCSDGVDDDLDQLIDCQDQDCVQREPCIETQCTDNLDGDHDGLIDCDDSDCSERQVCQEEDCSDGIDDDHDDLVDCDDPGCLNREPCIETKCADLEDGDGDLLIDCDDPDCSSKSLCHETSCTDDIDNNDDGLIDCADPECQNTLECPEVSCENGVDEDDNGVTDCDDPKCFDSEVCPQVVEEFCEDGVDNDGDNLIDCADADCALVCPSETCAEINLGSAIGIAVLQDTLEGRIDSWSPGDCTSLGSGQGAPDISISWTAPADGVYRISTLGSEADTVLTIFPSNCEADQELVCHDDLPGVSTSAVLLQIDAEQSVTIVVSAFDEEDAAPFRLHIWQVE